MYMIYILLMVSSVLLTS